MTEAIPDKRPEANRTDRGVLAARSILRKSSRLSAANLLGVLVLFPVNILMGRLLGPELLGVVGFVTLWQLYASFSRPGMFNAAYREMPGLLAQGKTAAATRIQNIGVTGDAIYLLIPTAVMLGAAFLQKDVLVRNGLLVGAMVFGLSQARDMYINLQWAYQRFGLIAKVNVLVTVVTAAFMVSTIWWLSYFTPLLSPGLAAVTVILALRLGAPSIGFRFQANRPEMWRLLKIGLPLGLSTLFYWAFRMADRTAVALWLSLTDLGYFSFVVQFINLAILLVSDFCNVVQPTLWAELGRVSSIQSLGPEIRRLSIMILVMTCVGTNLAQAGFGTMVYLLVPKFVPSVRVFEILAFLLALGTLGFVPTHLLNSSNVNKQTQVMVIWGLSLPINIGLAYLMVKMGWGLAGIAISSVLAQGLAAAVLLVVAQRRVSGGKQTQLPFYALILALLLVTFAVFGAFQFGPLAYSGQGNLLKTLMLRLVLFGIVWGTIGGLIYVYRRKASGRTLTGTQA